MPKYFDWQISPQLFAYFYCYGMWGKLEGKYSLLWLAQTLSVLSRLMRTLHCFVSLCLRIFMSPVPLSFHSAGSSVLSNLYSFARLKIKAHVFNDICTFGPALMTGLNDLVMARDLLCFGQQRAHIGSENSEHHAGHSDQPCCNWAGPHKNCPPKTLSILYTLPLTCLKLCITSSINKQKELKRICRQ